MGISEILDEALGKQFSVTFNGIDLSEYFYVKSDSGRGIMSRELSLLTLPSQDGGHLTGIKYPTRSIALEVVIACDSAEDLRKRLEEINEVLAVTKPAPLIFDDEPDRTYYAVSESVSEGYEKHGWHVTTINFICPEPFKHGGQQINKYTTSAVLVNQGAIFARPIIQLVFTKAQIDFKISRNSEDFKLIRNFVAGDRVTIDCTNQSVKLNGESAMPIRDWRTPFKRLSLSKGRNTFVSDTVADVTVTFTERFI